MENKRCEGCELYIDKRCIKWRKNGVCKPSTRDWLIRGKNDMPMEFIPVERICRKASIFGNKFVGLTQNDIDRLKNGEVIFIGGEYGTFIGFLPGED